MKNTSWKQFWKTGAVEDYLSYRNTGFISEKNNDLRNTFDSNVKGQERNNAGFSISDWNGNKDRTHW